MIAAAHGHPRPPPADVVHEDLGQKFVADAPDRLRCADISEHPTRGEKVYGCAVLDVFSRTVVGWSIADRMQSVNATPVPCRSWELFHGPCRHLPAKGRAWSTHRAEVVAWSPTASSPVTGSCGDGSTHHDRGLGQGSLGRAAMGVCVRSREISGPGASGSTPRCSAAVSPQLQGRSPPGCDRSPA